MHLRATLTAEDLYDTRLLWSIRNHQYDDMNGAALRVLSDDDVE
jgi:nitrogen fixation-related uncharacterized protein